MTPDVQECSQECASGNDYRRSANGKSKIALHAHSPFPVNYDPSNSSLLQVEFRMALQKPFHSKLISLLIALHSRRSNTLASGGVKHSEVNARGVSVFPHGATKSIDFAHQVAFTRTTNRGIARHLPDRV